MPLARRELLLGAASSMLAAAPLSRTESIEAVAASIDSECQAAANGLWQEWYAATAASRQALHGFVGAGFRSPRKSRFREDRLPLLRTPGSPYLFTASPDCAHICLYDYQKPDAPERPEEWIASLRMVAAVSAVSKWLASKGVDLVLAPVPRVVELYPKRFLGMGMPEEMAPHLRFVTRELLRAGVEVVDLLPAFRKAAATTGLYLATDSHWNDTAQRMAAKIVAGRLARYPYAQKGPKLYKTRPAEFRFGGYFYEYLTDDELAAMKPGMTETISEVLQMDGKPFSATPAAPVIVVGDSFTSFHHMAIGREQSGEAVAMRKAGDSFAEFHPPVGSGVAAYIAQELNVPVAHKAMLGGTLEPFRDLFREPELLKGVKTLVWILNTTALFRRDAYSVNFRTPAV